MTTRSSGPFYKSDKINFTENCIVFTYIFQMYFFPDVKLGTELELK